MLKDRAGKQKRKPRNNEKTPTKGKDSEVE
jgi:hypothetical protein